MTRPREEVEAARALIDAGISQAETARRLGIPRWTVRTWVRAGFAAERRDKSHDTCPHVAEATANPAYAYLLGLYLGDGYITAIPRDVYKLRISLDARCRGIITEAQHALGALHANRVFEIARDGCVEVGSYWKHWVCLFPQHGPGPKHKRPTYCPAAVAARG